MKKEKNGSKTTAKSYTVTNKQELILAKKHPILNIVTEKDRRKNQMINNTQIQERTAIDEGLRNYMLKVYNFMAGGLCVTALAAYVLMSSPSFMKIFYNFNSAGYVTGMSALGWIILFAPLVMVFAFNWVVARGTPQQVQMLFWGFSAVMGISLAPTLMIYTGASVARVFLITAAMFGGMSLYGYTTKKDLSGMGSFLIMGVWGIVIASIVNLFMQSPGLSYAISIIAVIAFTGLTAYDTQKIRQIYFSGDSSDVYTKKAILGALELYLDFINMFIALLRLFGDRR